MTGKQSDVKEYASDRETLIVQNSFDQSRSKAGIIRELLESGAFIEDGDEGL